MTAVAIEVPDVLLIAAALLEEQGWCQRQSRTGSGAMCVVGAIAAAAGGAKVREDGAQGALEAWVIWHGQERSVVDWNDAPARTKAEVVTALREAAAEYAA